MLSNWFAQPAGSRSDEGSRSDPEDDTQNLEEDQGNGSYFFSSKLLPRDNRLANPGFLVLSHIISQLRPGADLSRVVLPTFILEPRSMLERITKCAKILCPRSI
jgi:hypothetical protein